MIKLNFVGREEFVALLFDDRKEFLRRIHAPEAFVVKRFYEPSVILGLRRKVHASGLATESSWHPLLDGCPDYHRLHDNYPGAHVKAKMHGFYFHGWRPENDGLFQQFQEIFEMKCFLGGLDPSRYRRAIPSNGAIARVNFQNYPVGGGYLAEHVDPNSNFALIQTLVQASSFGTDFGGGGLFARDAAGGEKVYLDPVTEPGDLMVMSPAIPHGVDPVDSGRDYDWKRDAGKWTIIPIIVASDYPDPNTVKPRQLPAEESSDAG